MISLYPGPSQVHKHVPLYVKQAHAQGLLSMNHRSPAFMALCKHTVTLLKKKLNVPDNYTVLFTSSATECWEIIAQSLTSHTSLHVYNGAFGEKWFQYAQRLHPACTGMSFSMNEELNADAIPHCSAEVICLTHNETSNGTQLDHEVIERVQKKFHHSLVAVDATSSMGGVVLPFHVADVWFASVQKCFGLPAGLAVLICSPRAVARAKQLNERNHYNSLVFMLDMMDRWQTPYTPNVLGIYLLMRVLQDSKKITTIHRATLARARKWYALCSESNDLNLLITNTHVQSHTVLALTASPAIIEKTKKAALKKGFMLGDGYGALKATTLRIANFPVLEEFKIQDLRFNI